MFSLIQTKTTTFRLFGEDCWESPDRTSYVWKQPTRKFKVPMSNSNTENGAPIWDNRVFYSWWKKFLPLKTQSNSLDLTQNGSPGLYYLLCLSGLLYISVFVMESEFVPIQQQVWYRAGLIIDIVKFSLQSIWHQKKIKKYILKNSTVLFLFNNHDPASKDNPQI